MVPLSMMTTPVPMPRSTWPSPPRVAAGRPVARLAGRRRRPRRLRSSGRAPAPPSRAPPRKLAGMCRQWFFLQRLAHQRIDLPGRVGRRAFGIGFRQREGSEQRSSASPHSQRSWRRMRSRGLQAAALRRLRRRRCRWQRSGRPGGARERRSRRGDGRGGERLYSAAFFIAAVRPVLGWSIASTPGLRRPARPVRRPDTTLPRYHGRRFPSPDREAPGHRQRRPAPAVSEASCADVVDRYPLPPRCR